MSAMARRPELLAGLAVLLAAVSADAQADMLSVTWTLADLPSTITLCRDPNAIAFSSGGFGADEDWQALVDVDANSGTGYGGADVVLTAFTSIQSSPCSAVSANTVQSIDAGMLKWDPAQNTFVDSGQTATLTLDLANHTISVAADISGALAGLSAASLIHMYAVGIYYPTGGPTLQAYDSNNATPLYPDGSASLPSLDVQNCSAPCSTSATWYPLVDLTGVAATVHIFQNGFE